MRVLLTEDNADLLLAVSTSLRGAGLAVDTAADLPAADLALTVNSYDCAVFDRMLPAGDALEFVEDRRRAGWPVPVLFLTARAAPADVVTGLGVGDDYLVKPFEMAELVGRVLSLCRRAPSPSAPTVLRCGDLELDPGRHEVRRAGALLTLTRIEFAVLELLMRYQPRPVERRVLLRQVWDEQVDPSSNVLEVQIRQLRRKLRVPPMIHTARGTGYWIEPA
ncbi:response regulator transcription factor [Amycolatopsis jiangsuensis]|uniref:DNA-binding response OmpR family regulator n=1 Tax=Amycolatopsis jiangsuensis TaxID=1181879 RepID=A0A840J4K4_9PSEU|nr:response regulator transcription factor [Amycolatopsis jiangsuensis]MBB4688367.1 DNA-binding response OmpR family regulator [Amycolatopsis jiangsuensis]